jgi:hypothetical protein
LVEELAMPDGFSAWLNLEKYTAGQILLFGVGCFGWVIFYADVVRNIVRRKFLEIPAASVMTNIAWEFNWGFVFAPDMGLLFVWGYRLWFFLDLFIVYGLFKYGDKQVLNPILKRYLRPAAVFGILFWVAAIYFFVAQGYDTSLGLVSGYILNVILAALYILLFLRHPSGGEFSYPVAWSKGLGTALASVFCFIVHGDKAFLLALCVICFILDATYVALLTWRRGHPKAFEEAMAAAPLAAS